MTDWATDYAEAAATHRPFASATDRVAGLDIEQAYALQRQAVAALQTPVAGYKAALTATPAQQTMGIDTPIVGALLARGAHSPDTTVTLQRQALLETEFGFKLGSPVRDHVTAEQAMALVASCHPMLEIAAPNLTGKPNGLDLIATNSASYGYVTGAAVDLEQTDPDTVAVRLLDDQAQVCFSGNGRDVLNGQASALAWLINTVLDIGYTIEAGHLFMTGSIGGMQPARPGRYEAEFSGLTKLAITIA